MRWVAEYALRGRYQATIAAAIPASLPFLHWIFLVFIWVPFVVVALVVLAKGLKEGLGVAMWVSLPLLVGFAVGQDVSGLTALAAVVMTAALLRAGGSWELALYGATILAVIQVGLFGWLSGILYDEIIAGSYDAMNAYVESAPEGTSIALDEAVMRGIFPALWALSHGIMTIMVLMLARWCQSEVYHPGAFGDEIQRVRLARPMAIGLGLATLGLAGVPDLRVWAAVVSLPLVIGGACLIHALLKQRGVAQHWYVVFYASIVLFANPAMAILALVMIADSFLDLRRQTNV